jgi:hypothetical protein
VQSRVQAGNLIWDFETTFSSRCIFMLTPGFAYYMLLSGMNYQFNIRPGFFLKTLSIMLTVLMGIGFSYGGVLASSCEGGADCPVCTELSNGHIPGAAADMQSPGCIPDGQNSSCGFETGQDPDKFNSIISSASSYHQSHAGIFAAVSDKYVLPLLPKKRIPQNLLSDSGGANPIYLLYQSLLC